MKILVLLGGASAEREVSLASGAAVAKALVAKQHAVLGLDPATGTWFTEAELTAGDRSIARVPPPPLDDGRARAALKETLGEPRVASFDLVFIALHGGAGEDGTVQTLLSLAGARYTGSGPMASGVAMHKDTAKRLFRQAHIPTPDWIYPVRSAAECVERLGLPLIVKPVAEGSTVGLSLVKDPARLEEALQRAAPDPMAERFIAGRELSVGVLVDRALPPVEIIPKHELFDYECKYTDGMAEILCPAQLTGAISARLLKLALGAFGALGCRGYARVDFRLSRDEEAYCLEVNTLPGMTSHSLVPMAARAAGIDFSTLCERICAAALKPAPIPAA